VLCCVALLVVDVDDCVIILFFGWYLVPCVVMIALNACVGLALAATLCFAGWYSYIPCVVLLVVAVDARVIVLLVLY
jgi:hypothetical protein